VRTIAALLNLQYRKLPNGEYNHATVIALLSPQGEIEASSSKLGTPDETLLAKLRD
jgi:protein SCO1/2